MNLYSLENTEKIYFNFGIGIPLTGGFAVQIRNSDFFNGIPQDPQDLHFRP